MSDSVKPGDTFADLFGTYTVLDYHTEVDGVRLWNVRTPEGWTIHMAEEAITTSKKVAR